jgi:alkyl sulfatase BDS1-like metallo-beta-lactamase superfamily hydrolase
MAQGKYLHATEILNRLVFAEPQNQAARRLLADAYEQLGYRAESTSVRNTFLQGAFELRNGQPGGVPTSSTGPDVVRAMSTEQWLDFVAISMDPKKAEGLRSTINLVTPDNGEQFVIEMENATLTNIKGFQAAAPDLTLTINRSDLEQTMTGAKTLEAQIADGTATAEGDVGVLTQLGGLMVDFDPRFEIMPGTKARTAVIAHADPYQAVPERVIAE